MTAPTHVGGSPTEERRSAGCGPRGLALLASALTVAALAVWIAWSFMDPFGGAAFDGAAWRAGTRAVRTPMARAAAEEIRAGLPRAEVLGLLGGPDSERDTQDCGRHFGEQFLFSATRTLRYELESNSWTSLIGLDDAFLYVHLSVAGTVVDAEIGGG